MLEQLTFDGFGARSPWRRSAERQPVFFAFRPDAKATAQIAGLVQQLCDRHSLQEPPIAPERLHVSPQFLGNYGNAPQGMVAVANEIFSAISIPPFEVAFDRAATFRNNSLRCPVVLYPAIGNAAVTALDDALGAAMIKRGVRASPALHRTRHLTLAYDEQVVPDQAIDVIGWTVREVVLTHSVHGQSRHVDLARWALCA